MYITYVRNVWRLLVVVFIVRAESKRSPKLMVFITRIRAPLDTRLMRDRCEIQVNHVLATYWMVVRQG